MLDLITPENVSTETLKTIYDRALMETSYDKDGDLRVKDGICCRVFSKNDRIRLLLVFGFKSFVDDQRRLECINNINLEFIVVRASVGRTNNALFIDHDIMITGGITTDALVHTTRRFLAISIAAIAEHGKDLVD